VATHELDQCWAQYKLWQCQERGPGGAGPRPRQERMLRWQKGTRTLAPPLPCWSWRRAYVRTPPDRTATTMRARHGSGFARSPSLCCHPLAPTTAPASDELHARTGKRARVPMRRGRARPRVPVHRPARRHRSRFHPKL